MGGDRLALELGDGLDVVGREDPVGAARVVEREHAGPGLLVRLGEDRRILERALDGIDLAGERAAKMAAWSSMLTSSTSTPSLANKPFSCATKNGPLPTQMK